MKKIYAWLFIFFQILQKVAHFSYPELRLPSIFGCWNAIYKRFNEWSCKGKLINIFKELVVEPDLEWELIDGSIVKVHQHSSSAASGQESTIGKSVAGNTTKTNMAVDSYGLPNSF